MNSKEQPKRLGRGLAALLGDAAVPSSVNAPGVQHLAVDLLEPSPFQPRRTMAPEPLAELAASIAQRGVLQPLLVRPHPTEEGRYQIIAGERRWRAAQQVPLHEVPVLVRALSDTDAMAAGLVENLQRQDLNPVEEAEGYRRLMTEFKMTQEELAEAIGKSRPHVANMTRILKLPEKVLNLLRLGELSLGHAKALMAASDPLKLARLAVNKELTVRETEQLAEQEGRSIKDIELSRKPKFRDRTETEVLAAQLTERLGLPVRIADSGKGGSVWISYADLDQLDFLLSLLNR